jgi:hypothetical protein
MSRPFERNRTVTLGPVPQLGTSVSCELLANGVPLALKDPQCLHVFDE